uniref:Death domain-containing protein n=1 Tax=Amphimedon queenslandica TaxID=400682 RepID=A0A1X7UCW6_AMPQE
MVTDKYERTPLHYAALWGTPEVVEFLLSTGNCDPLAKDNKGMTPLKLAKGRRNDSDTVIAIFKKFGNIKISHPIDSYVNVFLVGNPGAGKTTLSHVINDTATGPFVLGSLRNVGGVVPYTAGIIPYKLRHKTLGNIILHDFAGHSEYYSSHSAVIENLLQGSGGVFLIVVNILEKEAVKQLHQWLTVVRNEAQKALNQCHVIVIVSHKDEISDPSERRRKEEIQEIIVRERCDSVCLDCRKLGGSGVDSFFNNLSSACNSIRSTSGRNLSLYCHMMYGLLEESKENILILYDIMSAGKDNYMYVIPDNRENVLDVLDLLQSTGLISVLKSEDKVWIVVNKGILLTEVDGILFAPETFKEHVDIASNTGIVSMSSLTRLFPKYDPGMLISFLMNMELCQELDPSFLRMTNLHQLAVEEGERERRGERLLFFPCLLSTDRPDEMTSQVYQFGWCLQCTSKHHFFPPRYFHVLSLHLAYKMALPQEDDKLNRYCTFWKNGLYWFNGHGVGSLVEIVDESECVLVMMSYEKGYSDNMVSLRRDVIGEVMSVYKESCPSLEVKELVIDPKELAYPVNTPRERTVYSVGAVLSAVVEQRPFLVTTGTRRSELKEILPDESLSDISNLSLLGRRDIKEVITIPEELNIPLIRIKLHVQEFKMTNQLLIIYSPTQISEYNDDKQKVTLTIRDLVEIKQVLRDGHFQTIKWFDLGLYLGLSYNDLKTIEHNYPRDTEQCLTECLAKWLINDIKATRNKLAIAACKAIAVDKRDKKRV